MLNKKLSEILNRSKESELLETYSGRVAIDRSVGVVLFAWIKNGDNEISFLANKRGTKTSEYKNFWNLPSGYLNWNETGEEGAIRETWEECGVYVDPEKLKLEEVDTNPGSNPRQNVILRYMTELDEFPELDQKKIQGEETVEVKMIKLSELENYNFAWKQLETIKRLSNIIKDC